MYPRKPITAFYQLVDPQTFDRQRTMNKLLRWPTKRHSARMTNTSDSWGENAAGNVQLRSTRAYFPATKGRGSYSLDTVLKIVVDAQRDRLVV